MSKWTPGPWELGDWWSPPNGGVSVLSGNAHIADVYAGHHHRDDVTKPIGRANARLIAAAPEMAEALERLTTRIHDCHSDVPRSIQIMSDEARALLARINGDEK